MSKEGGQSYHHVISRHLGIFVSAGRDKTKYYWNSPSLISRRLCTVQHSSASQSHRCTILAENMSYDRVIQDSDDEDDPVVGPHSPVQEYDNAHADDHLQADVQRHQEIEGNYDASMNIDFDQYLQSQERLPPGHSSPQHQPLERWVPTNSGGGSMGRTLELHAFALLSS